MVDHPEARWRIGQVSARTGLTARTLRYYEELGFGLGIERLIRWITRIDDIKDTILFPRTMSRVSP